MPAVRPFDVPEEVLVARARRGGRAAFAKLWARHVAAVRQAIAAKLPPSLVEDVVQEVALASLAGLSALRNEHGFGAWLIAIARNRACSAYASRCRDGVDCELDELPAPCSTVSAAEAHEVRSALRTLPRTYRNPLVMRLLRGLSSHEIADRLAMSEGSVRVNLCRGLKLLRHRLGDVGA
jgi:RNA polymerase sigma-70 factor (ECF subfamily)